MIERAVDLLAGELGMDPAEIRRINFVPPDAFPYRTPTGATYDSGDYERALDEALSLADYPRLREEQAARRAAGTRRELGIGIATFTEISGAGPEYGAVTVEPDGTVVVATGASPHGQGHVTALTQLVSGIFGVDAPSVRIEHSDTTKVARGTGTFGSRSGQLAGSAIVRAASAVMDQARDAAAAMLEVAPEDLVVGEGGLSVAGVPTRSVSWGEAASAAPDGRLWAEHDFAQEDGTYSFGADIAVVEVDLDTGKVTLERIIAVDDCGNVLNPQIVEGQVHGGIVQGVAQALFEEIRYDELGNPATANLADYGMPSAAEVPSFELGETITPTPHNPLGMKGVGESGTIGATAAIQNAVLDALAPHGVRHLDMPLSAERVWQALR